MALISKRINYVIKIHLFFKKRNVIKLRTSGVGKRKEAEIREYMETFMVCAIIVILIIIFAISVCKLSSKLELESQYEKPVPNHLSPATETEKDLFKSRYELVGTVYGGAYTKSLVDEWCKSLYVAHGIVVNARDSVTLGDGIQNTVRYATIKIDELQFEVELDKAILNDKVIVFYSKDDKGQMVYRFTIRKE